MFNKFWMDTEIINCRRCTLHELKVNDKFLFKQGCGKLIPIEGSESNDIMIIGLNPPNKRYEKLKHSFGASDNVEKNVVGNVFMKALEMLGVYNKCYITDAVKCSTENNEVENSYFMQCMAHLIDELTFCQPKLVIACGDSVYNLLKFITIECTVEKIFHPNYCFVQNKITPEEYILHLQKVFKKYGYC